MKFSKKYERDYEFYYKNRKNFIFCGTRVPKYQAIFDENGKSAKEVFYIIDSTGKNSPTNEPELLNELLLTKASVNFQIKQWREGFLDGTLEEREFAGGSLYIMTLIWSKNTNGDWIPLYSKSIKDYYDLPDWVVDIVLKNPELKKPI